MQLKVWDEGLNDWVTSGVPLVGDGALPVPATGTINDGKVLTAGSTAGNISWQVIPVATGSINGLMTAANFTKLSGIANNANNYAHPTGDGNLHVPVTSTSNDGKVLKAGSTAGSLAWGTLTATDVGLGSVNNTADAAKSVLSATRINDASYQRIVNPPGAVYTTNTATLTGAIAIVLPVTTTNTMLRMTIKIYEYTTNESFEVHVGGYNYSTGWSNSPFAYIIGNPTINRQFNIRMGQQADTKRVIYIGELASTWSYPQIAVTEVLMGYGGEGAAWVGNWSIGFQATAFENVTATITASQVGLYEATATNIKMNGTQDVGTAATVARGDHVHPSDTSRLPITGGTMTGVLTAQNNALYDTKQVRNIIISTSDAILANMANGDIWIKI